MVYVCVCVHTFYMCNIITWAVKVGVAKLDNSVSYSIVVASQWVWLGSVGVACVRIYLDTARYTVGCMVPYVQYVSHCIKPCKWVWYIWVI